VSSYSYLKAGTAIVVKTGSSCYKGFYKNMTETELYLKGPTKDWVIPTNQILWIKPAKELGHEFDEILLDKKLLK
jgi:hypothetical protein